MGYADKPITPFKFDAFIAFRSGRFFHNYFTGLFSLMPSLFLFSNSLIRWWAGVYLEAVLKTCIAWTAKRGSGRKIELVNQFFVDCSL